MAEHTKVGGPEVSDRIYISIDQGSHGGLQVSIGLENADGGGHGYRICGPKYDGASKQLKRHYITQRDADEIKSYLDKVSALSLVGQAPERGK